MDIRTFQFHECISKIIITKQADPKITKEFGKAIDKIK